MAFDFAFEIGTSDPDSAARSGLFHTPHGVIRTPVFAPVGTQATVKALTPQDLTSLGADLILANAYHLYLRPGAGLIARLGGLHGFMGWHGPILTDSGGFQVFSLANSRRVDDDGVTFRSHIDGSEHRFTPELVIDIEENLGADIIMCLDECADPIDRNYLEHAVRRTHLWAERCRAAQRRDDQALFGIVQGGVFADLRCQSARFLTDLDFAGYAIGGLSVGETKAQTYAALDATMPELPPHRPRYLMGVGAPEDILESVARGVDIFDCVLPTRVARNGGLLTSQGRLNIRNAQYSEDPGPVEVECGCYTCQHFSLAYLRHLFQAQEILGLRLATVHNLHFMLRFMEQVRSAIVAGTFTQFRDEFAAGYRLSDQHARLAGHAARRAAGALKRKEH
jgi:queuine tRNA-ribosyltransferase